MDIRDSLYCSKKCRETTDKMLVENNKLRKENELLKEQLHTLKEDIRVLYCDMMSLDTINQKELEDIEVL